MKHYEISLDLSAIAHLEFPKWYGMEIGYREECTIVVRLEHGYFYSDDDGSVVHWCDHDGVRRLILAHHNTFLCKSNETPCGRKKDATANEWQTLWLADQGAWEEHTEGITVKMVPNEDACKEFWKKEKRIHAGEWDDALDVDATA